MYGVRYAKVLAYADHFRNELPRHECLGEQISRQLPDLRRILYAKGFIASSKIGQAGHYVFERAFVEK